MCWDPGTYYTRSQSDVFDISNKNQGYSYLRKALDTVDMLLQAYGSTAQTWMYFVQFLFFENQFNFGLIMLYDTHQASEDF